MLQKHSPSAEQTPASEETTEQATASPLRIAVQTAVMALVLFAGFWGMNYLTALQQEPPSRPPFKSVYTVDSVIAEMGTFQPSMIVYGEVQTARNVELRSLLAGQVISVNSEIKVGGRVEQDEELFRIDPFLFETALKDAQANRLETLARIAENQARINIEKTKIERLRDQLRLARNDLERFQSLRDRGAATAKQLEDRELIVSQRQQSLEQSQLTLIAENARLDQLQATLLRFTASIAQAERNLEDTILKAPLSGIVSAKNIAVGRLLGVNDMVIAMYDANRLEVRFTLTDERFGRLQTDADGIVGRPVEIVWGVGGEEFRYDAVIDRIGAQITSNRGGVEVIAAIEGDVVSTNLRPGAFVEVIVPDKAFEDSFRLPASALYDNQTVYRIVDGELASANVRVHSRDGDYIIVTGEIAKGDEILATRIAEIADGLAVQLLDPAGSSGNSGAEQ